MTLLFDGNLEEFFGLFGAMVIPIMGEKGHEAIMEAAEELDGHIKVNISNGRYSFDCHMEGDLE